MHSQLLVATCGACIAACPQTALTISANGTPVLHAEDCTGCGACVPACPESALSLLLPVRDRALQTPGSRLTLVCDKHSASRGGEALPCVHAFGLAELARAWQAGLRRIDTATADCATCATCPADLLQDQLARFNTLARSRDLDGITHHRAGPKSLAAWREDQARHTAPDNSRRAFLRGLTTPARATPPDEAQTSALAGFLAQTAPDQTPLFPYSPTIDPDACSACDTCIQVCPHGALILINDKNQIPSYEITASACTGCGLCVDICDEDAIALVQMAGPAPDLPLGRFRCSACGNDQNTTKGAPPQDGLCRICRVNASRRSLFVVLP